MMAMGTGWAVHLASLHQKLKTAKARTSDYEYEHDYEHNRA